ncbi:MULTISPECIES: sigma-70 family RNA polymerase sigma factor [Brevundimonas]|uniref:sigma-70 family RNA polymerase sigma factor n=1 Tax=Brevundimonas TaxID=41275 RepID=UPI001907A23E|nr:MULTISPECIES: sigma-70 family RNA polymerase sigma factor [Brevundimonas]MBK1967842.1 sigma-70 family RNA polymerase sigma factor [Brevundimonas diminuta]MBK1975416.1 sigma-70 family RNA polymerase sigma factor [Brevundimonas diminuta]
MTPTDLKTETFEAERPRLLRLAYRMLGSLSEAEDVVQDGWLRWTGVSLSVEAPAAYLTRIITRLCLDRLKSARARRETYVGPWLPDPLVEALDPVETIADDVTVTLMLAMERLSPLERAAFLLHDIFEVPLKDVAATLDREPAAVRQLASRARRNVKAERSRYSLGAAEADRIARAFFEAAHGGDTARLAGLLARDVEIHADGGGKVSAFRNIVRGIDNVLRLFSHVSSNPRQRPTLVRTAVIDGLPGYVSYNPDGRLQTTALDLEDGRIRAIYIVRNPDKLTHVTTG